MKLEKHRYDDVIILKFTGEFDTFNLPGFSERIDSVLSTRPQPVKRVRPNLPDSVITLVDDMLTKKASRRPTAAEVVAACEARS